MQVRVTIETGNDAMRTAEDVADMLRDLARRLEDQQSHSLALTTLFARDHNGNTVGTLEVVA